MLNNKFKTREEYLNAAVEALRPVFLKADARIPAVKVSTGWPSSRGIAAKKRALGECWDASAATDNIPQVFISPYLVDPLHIDAGDGCGVLPVLAHEIVHVVLGNKEGHSKKFRKLATDIGLEGKMTATNAGTELQEICKSIAESLGVYPHAQLDKTKGGNGKKKQGTRMIKCECETCGYAVRTTQKWLEIGAPICPVSGHGPLKFDAPEGGDEDGED